MEITIPSALNLITSIVIISVGLVIFLGNNKPSSRVFSLCMLSVSLWIASTGLLIATTDDNVALFLIRSAYFFGNLIAILFLVFFLIYPNNKPFSKEIIYVLTLIEICFAYVFIFTDKIISNIYPELSYTKWGWGYGDFSLIFELIFFISFGAGVYILFKKYFTERNTQTKNNIKLMLLTICVGFIPSSFLSIILPRIGTFDFNWIGSFTQILWLPILSYSIFKYKQMDLQIVIIELFAISMAIIFFINFVGINMNTFIQILFYILFIIIALLLIRTSLREARQREMLRDLNLNLEQKVTEQTKEVHKAYELEKKARRDLEKLNETKDQFIMITQHNLRTPVTSIKYEVESILSGKHGEMGTEVRKTLADTSTSVETLMKIVNDFLNITTLKTGSRILNLSIENMRPLVESVLQELRLDIEKRQLTIDYPPDDSSLPNIRIDKNKIREVLLIIVENAVKYNIDGGKIVISNTILGNTLKIIVTNTGVGIAPEEKQNIFERLFYRSKRAQITHPTGMGIGLSVSRAIIRAHHGDLTIHSEGENEGATVEITIPFDFLKDLEKTL